MDTQLAQLLVFGTLACCFGAFASYMAARQKDREDSDKGSPPKTLL